MIKIPAKFSERVLAWFAEYGRKNLPWQNPISPYRVWVSEIMLQQTQVTTVIPYFQRFIQRFPDLAQLAAADIDAVLELWSGLGYYARGRNLHRTAQIIITDHKGEFPRNLMALQSLPGIGRSTAGAILALSMDTHATILDGNVKRVLARFHAIADWPGKPEVTKQLWRVAEQHTPTDGIAAYTQAMMDLGATVCTRSKPKCVICPLNQECLAYQQGAPTAYPVKKPQKTKPVRAVYLLLLQNAAGKILLEKRPPVGIWGGLWSLPECPMDVDVKNWCQKYFHCETGSLNYQAAFRHTFSHFHLDITPVSTTLTTRHPSLSEPDGNHWHSLEEINSLGLAAPVKKLLTTFLFQTVTY